MPKDARKELASRPDLLIIADLITEGTSVLDLGCGNGSLLHMLRHEKNIYGCGVELSQSKILECVRKGVPVLHGNLNDGLSEFTDKSFDFVILSQTVQAVKRPDKLIEDIIRVGRKGLISFMNIGYLGARLQLTLKGKMPVTKTLPDTWYNTPNIHLATIRDFRNLCKKKNIKITKEIPFGEKSNLLANCCPNLFAPTCVFVIE
jgi:methionine biosynthesis protein MetW